MQRFVRRATSRKVKQLDAPCSLRRTHSPRCLPTVKNEAQPVQTSIQSNEQPATDSLLDATLSSALLRVDEGSGFADALLAAAWAAKGSADEPQMSIRLPDTVEAMLLSLSNSACSADVASGVAQVGQHLSHVLSVLPQLQPDHQVALLGRCASYLPIQAPPFLPSKYGTTTTVAAQLLTWLAPALPSLPLAQLSRLCTSIMKLDPWLSYIDPQQIKASSDAGTAAQLPRATEALRAGRRTMHLMALGAAGGVGLSDVTGPPVIHLVATILQEAQSRLGAGANSQRSRELGRTDAGSALELLASVLDWADGVDAEEEQDLDRVPSLGGVRGSLQPLLVSYIGALVRSSHLLGPTSLAHLAEALVSLEASAASTSSTSLTAGSVLRHAIPANDVRPASPADMPDIPVEYSQPIGWLADAVASVCHAAWEQTSWSEHPQELAGLMSSLAILRVTPPHGQAWLARMLPQLRHPGLSALHPDDLVSLLLMLPHFLVSPASSTAAPSGTEQPTLSAAGGQEQEVPQWLRTWLAEYAAPVLCQRACELPTDSLVLALHALHLMHCPVACDREGRAHVAVTVPPPAAGQQPSASAPTSPTSPPAEASNPGQEVAGFAISSAPAGLVRVPEEVAAAEAASTLAAAAAAAQQECLTSGCTGEGEEGFSDGLCWSVQLRHALGSSLEGHGPGGVAHVLLLLPTLTPALLPDDNTGSGQQQIQSGSDSGAAAADIRPTPAQLPASNKAGLRGVYEVCFDALLAQIQGLRSSDVALVLRTLAATTSRALLGSPGLASSHPRLLDKVLQASTPLLPACQACELVEMAGHLSSLAHRPAAGWQAMYFATLGPRLGILKPDELVTLAVAVAALGLTPDEQYVSAVMSASASVMDQLTPEQVVTLTWALSHSCSTADHMWSQRFEAATLSRLQCLSLTQLTTLLKALNTLHHQPSPMWMISFLRATQGKLFSVDAMQRLPAWPTPGSILAAKDCDSSSSSTTRQQVQGLLPGSGGVFPDTLPPRPLDSTSSWEGSAVPYLSFSPGSSTSDSRFTICQGQHLGHGVVSGGSSSSRSSSSSSGGAPHAGVWGTEVLVGLVDALVRTRAHPPADWLTSFADAVRCKLSLFTANQLSLILLYFAAATHRPDPEWWQDYMAAMQARLREQSGKEMVTDLALLHALDVHPSHDYLSHWAAASKDRLVLLSAEHLASCLSCFASAGYTPDPDWLAAFTSALEGQVTTLGSAQLLRCTVILDRMGARLPRALLDHLYATSGPALVDVDPPVLAQLLWTLQSAAVPPPQPWLMDLIDAAQVQLVRFSQPQLETVLSGLHALATAVYNAPSPAQPHEQGQQEEAVGATPVAGNPRVDRQQLATRVAAFVAVAREFVV